MTAKRKGENQKLNPDIFEATWSLQEQHTHQRGGTYERERKFTRKSDTQHKIFERY
uniref:Uncharacterized protein n=1 Tax=Rhizophora mucronata TaxID=61149 RepID=A0A2P2N4M6_RHIMU